MQRTQISLSEHERALLDAEAARTGRSVAALIRDAVTTVYGRDPDRDADALRRSFGAWEPGPDGAAWVDERRPGKRPRHVADS